MAHAQDAAGSARRLYHFVRLLNRGGHRPPPIPDPQSHVHSSELWEMEGG